MRITVNGQRAEIQIKRSVDISKWNSQKECAIGKERKSMELNHYLDTVRMKVLQIHRELEQDGKPITADVLKRRYYGEGDSPKMLLEVFQEWGLVLFLIGAGVDGGAGFVQTLEKYGPLLFLWGALMTIVPLFIGFFLAKKVLKLSLFNNLGSITGGMTSTPALGALINTSGTPNVASAYAATYPIALVLVVLASQFLTYL